MELLEGMKLLLDIPEDDASQDGKLELILDSAKSRLKLLLGGLDPPDELSHIVLDAAVARFNRIGSEGTEGHDVEGESLSFANSDFSGYMDEIQAYLDGPRKAKRGGFRFL